MANCFERKDRQEVLKSRPWGHVELEKAIFSLLQHLRKGDDASQEELVETILDIGFGADARSTKALQACFQNASIDAIDNSIAALDIIYSGDVHALANNENVRFLFGDPEFALPQKKYDLIVLSMVCHCFEHPYRAIDNLIRYTLKPEGRLLFVHRTDPFMKAICGAQLTAADLENKAAMAIADLWHSSELAPKSKYRLISEHESIAYYLDMSGARIIVRHKIDLRGKSEKVIDVLRAKSYSPLCDLARGLNDFISTESIDNTQLQLSLFLYSAPKNMQDVVIASCVQPVSLHNAVLEVGEIRALAEGKHDTPGFTSFCKKTKEWFTDDASIKEVDIPFGFYVDLRRQIEVSTAPSSPRAQLWGEELFPEGQPEGSLSLIHALQKGDSLAKVFFCLVWVYLPDIRAASEQYRLMPRIMAIGGEECWRLIPYATSTNLRTLLKDVLTLDESSWDELQMYISSIYKKANEKGFSVTYYFRFRDMHQSGNPIAFSFQASKWLTITEWSQLAIISQSALAAVNDGLSSYRVGMALKYDQIKEKLQGVAEQLKVLEKISSEVRDLREIVDPDSTVQGTSTFLELGKTLNDVFPQGDLHTPAGHVSTEKLKTYFNDKAKNSFKKLKEELIRDPHGVYDNNFVENLFMPLDIIEGNRDECTPVLTSVCLAKDIASYRLPAAWVLLALGSDACAEEYWRFYWQMTNPESCMRALKAMRIIRAQMNLRNVSMALEKTSSDVPITAILTYENDFQTFKQAVEPVILKTEQEPMRGSLRQALRWLQAVGLEIAIVDGKFPLYKAGLLVFSNDRIELMGKWERYPDCLAAMRGRADRA